MLPYPALHATHAGIWRALPGDAARAVGRGEAVRAAADTPHLLLNAPVTASRLGYPALTGLDVLELWAFARPAQFVVPTAATLADELGLPAPARPGDEAALLGPIAAMLLNEVGAPDGPARAGAWDAAAALARLRWAWGVEVLQRLERPEKSERSLWTALPKWEDVGQRPSPRTVRLDDAKVEARLEGLTGEGAERRDGQRAYAKAAAHAFAPRAERVPHVVLAEAGTGIGKTLGYLAPATLWAGEAGGAVWLSTYTKALQRQLDAESRRAFPDATERRAKVVVRKGRENYLCLLNLEDAVQGAFAGRAGIFARLAERWARFTRDGDLVGGDMPGWLPSLFGRAALNGLTDRRGECVYASCPHYRTCFIERASRASAGADLVIANHALVMANAVRGRAEGRGLQRIVFDEGHHLFEAADGAFALALTGGEAIELRRWLLGPERTTRGRRRGLTARLSDVAAYDEGVAAGVRQVCAAAAALPADGWLGRLVEGAPNGPLEHLLAGIRAQVHARARASDAGFSIETEIAEALPAVADAVPDALAALGALAGPIAALAAALDRVLEDAPDWLDGPARGRLEGAIAGLTLRHALLGAWSGLVARIGGPGEGDFVDWFEVVRHEGRELDVGARRHWLDPTRPLAEAVLAPAHGVLVTSATLGDDVAAVARTGAVHLGSAPAIFRAASPFDYAAHSRVLIVTDVTKGDIPATAHAFAKLIEAAGGGTLGLFNAVARLRGVHSRLADRMAGLGLPLHAQHVDPIDTGTLVDIFRADPRASLLGTDALRDGVDVPGESLRLVVMEGVPWPRPTVLHAARRVAFGGTTYDDMVTAGRIAQAFGRLIRRADDRGVFVLLGAAVPSRLLRGLPDGVGVERLALDAAVARVRAVLGRERRPVTTGA